MPADEALRAAAEKIRTNLPVEMARDLDQLLAKFRTWLENPAIHSVLRHSAYADPQQPGFPAVLAPFWKETIRPQQLERERRFLVPDGAKLWDGTFDRVVWLGDGDRIMAADVLDFKTEAISPGDAAVLNARTEHYRPQMEAYRSAAARLAQLPLECVATRLVFTTAGRVVEV